MSHDPPVPSAALRACLGGIDRATLMRRLGDLGSSLVRLGNARRSAYALRRPLRAREAPLPLFRIDADGEGELVGHLSLLEPRGSALELASDFPWPRDAGAMQDGWFEGLPYPLYDIAPQGFLGRHFAHQHASLLGVDADPRYWSDEALLHILSVVGSDLPGDLILGEVAYRKEIEGRTARQCALLETADRAVAYPALAERAMALGDVGSSAGGEFPKFTAHIRIEGEPRAVIVKFSGADDSPAVRRWSDLLVCEHLALETIREQLGIPVATSRVLHQGGRCFLEVERFDRQGLHGRQPVCTLASLNSALLGLDGRHWSTAASMLAQQGWLRDRDVRHIQCLTWFGRLIANNDMHDGNLAFQPGLRLAPVYDMLPMRYAPLRGGEVPPVDFTPPAPLPGERDVWHQAQTAARVFWARAAEDSRISAAFRRVGAENLDKLLAG